MKLTLNLIVKTFNPQQTLCATPLLAFVPDVKMNTQRVWRKERLTLITKRTNNLMTTKISTLVICQNTIQFSQTLQSINLQIRTNNKYMYKTSCLQTQISLQYYLFFCQYTHLSLWHICKKTYDQFYYLKFLILKIFLITKTTTNSNQLHYYTSKKINPISVLRICEL